MRKLIYYRTMSRKKFRNIRNKKLYYDKARKGLFEKNKYDVWRLERKNFFVRWLNGYKYKKAIMEFGSYKDINIQFQMPLAEGIAKVLVDTYKGRLK